MKEELYRWTSKGAEGYAPRLAFKKAKEEGMNIAIQWQDADSSSSKAVTDHFPDAKVMICGGHVGRAHKKQLEKLKKIKKFSPNLVARYDKQFPSVVMWSVTVQGTSQDADAFLVISLKELETTFL